MLRAISINNTTGDITVRGDQNTHWSLDFRVFSDAAFTIPKNLTGYTAEGWYKRAAGDPAKLITFTCTILPYNAITNPNTNIVRLSTTPAQSKDIKVRSGVFIIKTVSAMDTEVIGRGPMTLVPE